MGKKYTYLNVPTVGCGFNLHHNYSCIFLMSVEKIIYLAEFVITITDDCIRGFVLLCLK